MTICKRTAVLSFLLLTFMTQVSQAQGEAVALLERVQTIFSRVNDYQVDIRATVNMKRLNVPDMEATLYYKKPNNVHIESDGFAMLPRDAVGFDPLRFEKDMYDAVIQGTEKIGGVTCTKLKLLARSDTIRLQRITLYVDTKRDIVLRLDADPDGGAAAQASFTYTHVDGKYWMPERIDISMPSPMNFRRPGAKKKKDDGDSKATVTVRYSNYVINKGIPDSRFK
ncbi:outer membrane lipoprotein-sorting protein [bacterium]|nr:outer membrane lipoprotein-sorting protein [bacterium]